ncbi:hypothetical protein VHUM_00936 [Vanrija humicola]|uniref:Niemann-Pick C1 N-terminal domain-containing protein n=1 Tax=Vanrija humicola TaxID=5417 RepID=A0A7D8Z2X4_VANHU|nr:hypothetical protein VHUM_00936 [Vanrija humicola]
MRTTTRRLLILVVLAVLALLPLAHAEVIKSSGGYWCKCELPANAWPTPHPTLPPSHASAAGRASADVVFPPSASPSHACSISSRAPGQCFTNSTILPLLHPDDKSRPCLSCTRQFCLDQKLEICKGATVPELDNDTGTGTEGDVTATCFRRDSPRDQVIVTCFVLVCLALLLVAAVRARLRKAVEQRGAQPIDLREWGQALLPEPLHASVFGRNNQRYGPVSVGS